jgi:hypothetical protein
MNNLQQTSVAASKGSQHSDRDDDINEDINRESGNTDGYHPKSQEEVKQEKLLEDDVALKQSIEGQVDSDDRLMQGMEDVPTNVH